MRALRVRPGSRLANQGQAFSWRPAVLACVAALAAGLHAQAPAAATVEIEFTNVKLLPPHWVLKLNPDGSGQFDAEAGLATAEQASTATPGAIHQKIQLSAAFTGQVFTVARERKLFAYPCESHMKVAFQGNKRLSYTGPEGSGACEFNYSKDKEIQQLGDSLLAVANTLVYGARLEMLLQHDRLGLDKETENLASAVHDGNAQEMGAIRETLERIASDENVLDRARRRARQLLATAR